MTRSQLKKRKDVLNHQILRLAKLYTSKKVCGANIHWHNRIGELQRQLITEKHSIRSAEMIALANQIQSPTKSINP